jgi:hypothetical protein
MAKARYVLFIIFQACSQRNFNVSLNLNKYLDAVMDHREHITLDASYVKVFHVQHLGRDNGDKNKDSEYALFKKEIPQLMGST